MTIAKQMEIRKNIKYYFDMAFNGNTILVPRKENKNVVVISQSEYEELQRVKRNAEYLEKLDKRIEEGKKGKSITFTIEELKAMESENWTPTQKVLDYMEKINHE